MNNRVNVLYLTTKCNLACDYCYEEASRLNLPDQLSVTTEDIDKYLLEISKREKGCVSTVVIMGGEPFMKYELLYYTILKMREFKNHKWGVSVITNTTLAPISLVMELLKVKGLNTSLTFELSYDVSGHFRRVYRRSGRSSRTVVENSIKSFIENKIPFKISYTIHKDNYNNFIKDCIYIFERFGTDYIQSIKTSINCSELGDMFNGDYEKAINKLRPYAEVLTEKYSVPICDLVCCTKCFKCDKSNFIGKSTFITDNIKYEELKTEKMFDSW